MLPTPTVLSVLELEKSMRALLDLLPSMGAKEGGKLDLVGEA
jgi:hypothetical protein